MGGNRARGENRVNIGKLGRIETRPRTVAIDRYIQAGFSRPITIGDHGTLILGYWPDNNETSAAIVG